jgi:hypothetical protein
MTFFRECEAFEKIAKGITPELFKDQDAGETSGCGFWAARPAKSVSVRHPSAEGGGTSSAPSGDPGVRLGSRFHLLHRTGRDRSAIGGMGEYRILAKPARVSVIVAATAQSCGMFRQNGPERAWFAYAASLTTRMRPCARARFRGPSVIVMSTSWPSAVRRRISRALEKFANRPFNSAETFG